MDCDEALLSLWVLLLLYATCAHWLMAGCDGYFASSCQLNCSLLSTTFCLNSNDWDEISLSLCPSLLWHELMLACQVFLSFFRLLQGLVFQNWAFPLDWDENCSLSQHFGLGWMLALQDSESGVLWWRWFYCFTSHQSFPLVFSNPFHAFEDGFQFFLRFWRWLFWILLQRFVVICRRLEPLGCTVPSYRPNFVSLYLYIFV